MNDATWARLPEPFCYYREILKSDHLHFGLWREDSPQMSMEEAQQTMFEYLLSFFPPPPATVLDVGCGLGLSAYLLSQKGYQVTAIAPTYEMIQYAQQTYGGKGIRFEVLSFFDEHEVIFGREQYDVLLFQESAQYLSPLDALMKKSRQLLKDKGFLIIGDEVCYDRSIKPETVVHMANDFIIAFAEHGFYITENKKIGKGVFPTHDFVIAELTRYNDRMVTECVEKATKDRINFYINGWEEQKDWNLQGKTGYEIFVARKDKFFINQYALGDETQILVMFREVFNAERSLEHWNWKFRDNPYGKYMISEAFSNSGRLVAHYGGYPVPFYNDTGIGPQTFISYQGGDTMTRNEVRNIGLGKTNILSRTAYHCFAKFLEGRMPFAYGFNTGKIKILGKKYLGYGYFDDVIFRVRNILRNPLSRSGFSLIFSKFRVEEVNSFTNEWDDFFDRVCHSYNLLVSRDSQYLKWRYLDCPDKDYKIFSVFRAGKLVGWSVFLKKDDRLIWGDALFDGRYLEAITYLLYFVQSSPIGRGVEYIEGWFSKNPIWWNNILDKIGFDVKEEPNRLCFCYKIFDRPDMTEVLDKFLYYTSGDSDLF